MGLLDDLLKQLQAYQKPKNQNFYNVPNRTGYEYYKDPVAIKQQRDLYKQDTLLSQPAPKMKGLNEKQQESFQSNYARLAKANTEEGRNKNRQFLLERLKENPASLSNSELDFLQGRSKTNKNMFETILTSGDKTGMPKRNFYTDSDSYNKDRSIMLDRLGKDPNSLSPREKAFALGQITYKPDAYQEAYEMKQKQLERQRKSDESSSQVYQEDKLYELEKAKNKAEKSNEWSLNTRKDSFLNDKDFKNTLISDMNMDHLSKKDIKALKEAKDSGKDKVLIEYNGKRREVKIDDALKYDDSVLNRMTYNLKNKNVFENAWESTKKDMADGFHYGMGLLDIVGQPVKATIKKNEENGGINPGKVLKIFDFNDGNIGDRTKDVFKYLGNKRDEQLNTFKNDPKQFAKQQFDISPVIAGGKQMKDVVTGELVKDPSKNIQFSEFLKKGGWNEDNLWTKVMGFTGDVGTSITPAGFSKKAVSSGGKFIGNSPKDLLALEKEITKRIGGKTLADSTSATGTVAKNLLADMKAGKQVSRKQIDDLFKTEGDVAFQRSIGQQQQALQSQIDDNLANLTGSSRKVKKQLKKDNMGLQSQLDDLLNPANKEEFLTKFAKDNAFNKDYLTHSFLSPMERQTGWMRAIKDSSPVKAITDRIGNTQPAIKIGNSFSKTFNKTAGVDPFMVNFLKSRLGEGSFQKSVHTGDLKELLKNVKKSDSEAISKAMIRPNEFQMPSVATKDVTFKGVTKPLSEHLEDFRGLSRNIENEAVGKYGGEATKFIENYLPGVYKNNEKKLTEVFGPNYRQSTNISSTGRKEKVFQDFLAAKDAGIGLKPIEDVGKLLNYRTNQAVDFATKKQLSSELEQLKNLNPSLMNAPTERLFDEFINPQNYMRGPRGAIGTVAKGVTDKTKALLLNTMPATAVRNILGGAHNAWIDGANLKDFGRAFAYKTGMKKGITTDTGEKISREVIDREMAKQGIGSGQYNLDMVDDIFDGNNFGKQNPIKQFLNNFNPISRDAITAKAFGKGEEYVRSVPFLKELQKHGLDGVESAGAAAKRSQFDYDPRFLTNFEKNLKDYAIPFYTFQRYNLPFMASKIGTNPNRFNALATHLPNAFNGGEDDPRNSATTVPDYLKDYLFTGKDKDGTGHYIPTNWMGMNDFKDWSNPVQKVANSLSPFIKGGIDLVRDKETIGGMNQEGSRTPIFGQPAGQFVDKNMPFLGNILGLEKAEDGNVYQSAKNQQFWKNIIPQLTNADSITRTFQNKGSDAWTDPKILNKLIAVAPSDVNLAEQEGYQRKNLINDLKQYEGDVEKAKQDEIDKAQKEDENKPSSYDVEKAYYESNKWITDTQKKLAENGGNHVEKQKTDAYGTKQYSVTGDYIGYIPKKAPTTEKQLYFYQKEMDDVAKGREAMQQKLAMLQNRPTLDEMFQFDNVKDPYKERLKIQELLAQMERFNRKNY